MQGDQSSQNASGAAANEDQLAPLLYDIRVDGHLDARWASRFAGLQLTNEDGGTTLLHGPVVDQAALHGLLQRLRDMGLPLRSIAQVDADGADAPATDQPTAESTKGNLT